jgi:Mucin-like
MTDAAADQAKPLGDTAADQARPNTDAGTDQATPNTDTGTDQATPMTDAGTDQATPMTDAEADQARPSQPISPRSWRPLALLVAAQLLAGVLAGLVWRATAPSTVSYLLSGADGKPPFVIPDESEAQIAGDGRFVLLSIGLGMVFGLAAWRLRMVRGPIVLGALAAAGLLSSVLARAVGELLSTGSAHRQLNATFTPQLSLHAPPALAVQAFFAVLIYTARAGLSSDPDLADPDPASSRASADANPAGGRAST